MSEFLSHVYHYAFSISRYIYIERKQVLQYNAIIRHLQAYKDIAMQMQHLDLDKLHTGDITTLCDKSGAGKLLQFASHKIRRVARSLIAPETYAFTDAFDFSYCKKREIETILEQGVALHLFTHSKSLFDIWTSTNDWS